MESERRSRDIEHSYETMKAYLDEVLKEVKKVNRGKRRGNMVIIW
jgi:hypothetical protein